MTRPTSVGSIDASSMAAWIIRPDPSAIATVASSSHVAQSGSGRSWARPVLPSIGAALVAAGIITLLQAESLAGIRSMVDGGVLVAAGAVVAVIGSIVTNAVVTNALVPVGGAMVTAGIISAVSGAAALSSRARLHAA